MAPRRKISPRQLEMLVEFAESHEDIALSRSSGVPQSARVTRELWVSIALQLNAVAEGSTKTSDQWRRYWIEFKAKSKAKAADLRRRAVTTRGGPNTLAPLTDIEHRVLALIGPAAVKGLPGVHLPDDIGEHSAAPVASSPELLMDVEWLEEETPPPLERQHSEAQILSPPPSVVMQPADSVGLEPRRQSDVSIRDRSAQRSTPSARRARPHTQRSAQRSNTSQRHRTPIARRAKAQSQIRRDETVPRWVYQTELRHIAAVERHAAAMEAMVELIRDIRDDVRTYVHRHSSP